MSTLKIGGGALNQIPLDWKGNLSNILAAIALAKQRNFDLLNLPELCITGYGCEDMFQSDWVCQRAWSVIDELLPHTTTLAVVVGLPLRYNENTYNASLFLADQKVKGIYCKRHLAKAGVHYEPRWFDSWKAGCTDQFKRNKHQCPIGDIDIGYRGIKIGFEICEDAWRKDRPADKFLEQPVDLVLNPSASHFAFGKALFREKLVVASSEKYNCYYLYTNLLGNESGRMIFDGDIIIAGKGNLFQRNKRLSFQQFNLIAATIDFKTDEVNTAPLNPWVESQNEEFTAAATLALFDYIRKSGSRGFVLSLSGGADSSTCAVLVAEMVRRAACELGLPLFLKRTGLTTKEVRLTNKEIVSQILYTAYQETNNSSSSTLDSARQLAEYIGAQFFHWSINEEVQSYTNKVEQALGQHLTWERDDVTLQNIQARVRSPAVWMIANKKDCLLLATSNRSEGDVGYATMDGDTSGCLSPIAAVDKPFILQWLKWAEQKLGYTGLTLVNSLQPTAELRPLATSQTDETDLMAYPLLLEIEKLAIRNKKAPLEIYQILSSEHTVTKAVLKAGIIKFFRLWSRNQWKRERLAPSFHFDEFNIDPRSWMRFPILSSGFDEELQALERYETVS